MESPDHDDHGSGRTGEKPGWTGTPTPHDSDNSGVESENTSYNKNNMYKNTKGREDEGAYGTPAPVYLSPTADSVPTPHNIGYEQEKDPSVVSKSDTKTEGRDIHPDPPGPDYLPPLKREQEQLTIEAIDPEAYTQVHGIHSGPCAICGAKWVHYIEKQPSGEKGEEKISHVLCQKCYSKAVARVSLSFTALPGTLNTSRMGEADGLWQMFSL